ncbi:MAG TPA: phosphoenolpyruvate carboxykinase domain-containing protein [Spirochaetia bacterium]|nr:phosphoenolpyruvate carboxykinase domain-containing protein [Spirochaetia bacterium]
MITTGSGADILQQVGGIGSLDAAKKLFARMLSGNIAQRLLSLANEEAICRIANAISLCEPAEVFVHSGSLDDMQYVREMAIRGGEEFPLSLPGHTCHFDLPEDQGRMIDRTFYIADDSEEVSRLAKSLPRTEALAFVEAEMRGIMRGRTMIVGAYTRGPSGAQAAVPALEISDSFYVIHSADILYANIFSQFAAECARVGFVFTNLHGMGRLNRETVANARIFMDRSRLTTYSIRCSYAGNSLMLKKGNHRFAIDIATRRRRGRELSEHMFITGLTGPSGRKTFVAGAAPSGCGKTTTAMVGSDFIGDDLAQLWIGTDGSVRAVNPEVGIFGIVQDVNWNGDPILMRCLREERTEVIWSNVLVDDSGTPRWVGDGDALPSHGRNWLGEWNPRSVDSAGAAIPISHPNARITLRSSAIDNYNREAAVDPDGVPIRVITYSGRDSDTMPPVWVAKSAAEGVVIGASILSAATATEMGARGVKRQPWANAAFIPGPLAEYMKAQFEFFDSSELKERLVICGLNYFLTKEARGAEGSGLLGEKRDVIVWLSWLERRAHDEVTAIETPIGFIPEHADLRELFRDIIDKEYGEELYIRQFSFYADNMISRIDMQADAYRKEAGVPPLLFEIYSRQREGLLRLKERFGPIIAPEQLRSYASLTPT